MERTGDLNFSFSGLKTAVVTLFNRQPLDTIERADLAAEFQCAIVEVLARKALEALRQTGLTQLIVAGGVGANRLLRDRLAAGARNRGYDVYYPPLEFCTDNGAMIAFAAALRLEHSALNTHRSSVKHGFTVKPRWDLEEMEAAPSAIDRTA